jgi:hypothetical protein
VLESKALALDAPHRSRLLYPVAGSFTTCGSSFIPPRQAQRTARTCRSVLAAVAVVRAQYRCAPRRSFLLVGSANQHSTGSTTRIQLSRACSEHFAGGEVQRRVRLEVASACIRAWPARAPGRTGRMGPVR